MEGTMYVLSIMLGISVGGRVLGAFVVGNGVTGSSVICNDVTRTSVVGNGMIVFTVVGDGVTGASGVSNGVMGALVVGDIVIGASVGDKVGGRAGIDLGNLEGEKVDTSVGRLNDGRLRWLLCRILRYRLVYGSSFCTDHHIIYIL